MVVFEQFATMGLRRPSLLFLALLLVCLASSTWRARGQEESGVEVEAVAGTPAYTQLHICESNDPTLLGVYSMVS